VSSADCDGSPARPSAGSASTTPRGTSWRRAWTLIWTLMDPVSYVSCVSWKYWVNAGETYETFHWESGMRYHPTRVCIAIIDIRRVGRSDA